jgi:large-conductance mechanosensitive channel
MLSWFMPFIYLVVFIVLGVFVIAVSRISKRNVKLYEDSLGRQKEMMDRQKEAVELLREIRDLLKK